MQEKSKNNNGRNHPSADENPFLNNNLYPVTGLLSISFIDKYIGCNFRPYENTLDEKFISNNSIDINEAYSDAINIINESIKEFKTLADAVNENDMKELKFIYKTFCDQFDSNVSKMQLPDEISLSLNENNRNMILTPYNNMEKMRLQFRKQKFTEAIYHYFYDPLIEKINTFNKYNTNSSIFIDNSEIVCLSKTKKVISKTDSLLTKFELDLLHQYTPMIFKSMEDQLHIKTNYIFLVYFTLLLGFRNRPVGVLMTDQRSNSIIQGIDYYNSEEVIHMLDNGFLDIYMNSLGISNLDLPEYNMRNFGKNDFGDDDDFFDDEDG